MGALHPGASSPCQRRTTSGEFGTRALGFVPRNDADRLARNLGVWRPGLRGDLAWRLWSGRCAPCPPTRSDQKGERSDDLDPHQVVGSNRSESSASGLKAIYFSFPLPVEGMWKVTPVDTNEVYSLDKRVAGGGSSTASRRDAARARMEAHGSATCPRCGKRICAVEGEVLQMQRRTQL